MDPISLTLGLVGLGTSLFGSILGSGEAEKAAGINRDIAQQELNVQGQKQQQMVLYSRRQQLENIRNTQRARAMGLAAATNQGAQFGTGLQGGQAQATDQGTSNALGINQNLQIGQNIFGFDQKISQDRIALSGISSSMATDSAISNFGNSISKSSSIFGNLFSSFGSGSNSGNYSGTPGASNTGGLY